PSRRSPPSSGLFQRGSKGGRCRHPLPDGHRALFAAGRLYPGRAGERPGGSILPHREIPEAPGPRHARAACLGGAFCTSSEIARPEQKFIEDLQKVPEEPQKVPKESQK